MAMIHVGDIREKSIKLNSVFNSDYFKDSPSVLIFMEYSKLLEYIVDFFSPKYECVSVSNGNEALNLIREQNFSLVIADAAITEKDGFDLFLKTKSNLNTCHIPFILLTAKNNKEQIIKGFEFGADDFISKPPDINLLEKKVEGLIINRLRITENYRAQNFMVETKINKTKNEQFVEEVKRITLENISDPDFNVNKLSEKLHMSATQLYRKLKLAVNYSPVEFIRILRLEYASHQMSQRDISVKELCYLSGFNNTSYFIQCFKEMFNTTPAQMKKNDYNKLDKNGYTV